MYTVEEVRMLTKFRIDYCRNRYGVRFIYKPDSKLMRFLFVALLMRWWNPHFMRAYTSTLGRTIYLSRPLSQFGQGSVYDLALLNHEVQHIKDSILFGRALWSFLYVFPQSLAPLALLAFFHPLFLVFLVTLAPLPAPFRVWAEVRAYGVSLATRERMGLEVGAMQLEQQRGKFMGWNYYRMAWRWPAVRDQLERRWLISRAEMHSEAGVAPN